MFLLPHVALLAKSLDTPDVDFWSRGTYEAVAKVHFSCYYSLFSLILTNQHKIWSKKMFFRPRVCSFDPEVGPSWTRSGGETE